LAGSYSGSIDFGAGKRVSAGGFDGFVATFSSDGSLVWDTTWGGTLQQGLAGAALDSTTGSLVVMGTTEGSMQVGSTQLTSRGLHDVFVLKMDASGTLQWAQSFGDDQEQSAGAVAVHASGMIAVSGRFQGTMQMGSSPALCAPKTPSDDPLEGIFVAKLLPTGDTVWSKSLTEFGLAWEYATDTIQIDPTGGLLLAGSAYHDVDLGGGPLKASNADGWPSLYVVKLDGDGNHLWSETSSVMGQAVGMALTPQGDAIVVGAHGGPFSLGGQQGPQQSQDMVDTLVLAIDN
jgi:hypothetical protein